MMPSKIAIVLFNLGGPDSLKAVRPFLFNLFYDPAIIRLPNPFRWLFAQLISRLRTKKAQAIYEKLGGKSPLLENTQAQALALEQALSSYAEVAYKVFIAMRCWHPLTDETIQQVKIYNPDKIILLPLYPQFSTTTTASSFQEWDDQAAKYSLKVPTHKVEAYYNEPLFIRAHIDLLLPVYQQAKAYGKPRLLFSAHSLPQKVIDAGDPYQRQTEETVKAIVDRLSVYLEQDIDYQICYQSRVGPVKWLTPTTEQALDKAAQDKVPVVIVPVSFVSEHSETLVELDNDYKKYAQEKAIPFYGRVPTLSCHPLFIESLANLCQKSLA
jgi:ferrochelatase